MRIYDNRYDVLYDNAVDAIVAIEKASSIRGTPIYYRGQSTDWAISSSYFRLKKEDMDIEREKTDSFIVWCLLNTKIPKFTTSDDFLGTELPYYYAIAQHYGYKTDLIDFTTCIELLTAFPSLAHVQMVSA